MEWIHIITGFVWGIFLTNVVRDVMDARRLSNGIHGYDRRNADQGQDREA